MPQGTGMRCNSCQHVLKYLYERSNEIVTSKKGKEYRKHSYKERALYCKRCDVVYPLNLEQKMDNLKKLI